MGDQTALCIENAKWLYKMKWLPGILVFTTEVEGKRVEKIMVDGKDFFDGDTKLATKNILSGFKLKIN